MADYTLREIKKIAKQVNDIGVYSWREVIDNLADENVDFEVDGFRFIADNVIDSVQQDELESDDYVLGCFASWLIADILDIDSETVEEIQKTAPQALGKLLIAQDKVAEIQYEYVRHDGYGHHFAHYDGEHHEMFGYNAFRVN